MSSKKKQSSHIFDILRSEFANADYGLRAFRSDVAKLRKLGLVSKRTDARKQKPTRYMRDLVRSFADLLKGEAQVFSVPKNEAPAYKAAGHRTKTIGKSHRVVVPAAKGAKVKRAKPINGAPAYETEFPGPSGAKGARVTHVLVPANTLRAKLRQWITHLPPLKKGEYYAFRYRNNMSLRTFSGPDARQDMIAYMERYIPDELDEEETEEYFMQFEFIQIENQKAWMDGVRAQQKRTEENRKRRNRERANEWRRKRVARMTEEERKEYNKKSDAAKERDKAYHKAKRDARTPEQIERDKQASKIRMQKSRAARKSAK